MEEYLRKIEDYESEERFNLRAKLCKEQQRIKSVTNFVKKDSIEPSLLDVFRTKN